MNVKILVLEIQRNLQTLALNGRQKRGVNVEIDRVAKLVALAGRGGLDARRKINRVVTAGCAFAETPKHISQRFVAEKIETLFSDFEAHVARQRLRKLALPTKAELFLLLRVLLRFLGVKR